MTRNLYTAHDFGLWLLAQAESNALEGQHETAARIRDLAALVTEHPAEFEAYMADRRSK